MFIAGRDMCKYTKAPEEGSGEAGLLFAPAERNVYSRAACANIPKPQRGDMFIAGRTCDGKGPGLLFAPAGRHVYRQATCAL